MSRKAWICAIVTSAAITVGLIFLLDYIWPNEKVITKVVPLVVGALITHFIRKFFDFIFDAFNRSPEQPFLGVSVTVDHASRKFVAYGASCGRVIQAGNFKADYDLEVDLIVTVQNESPYTAYKLNLSYSPNEYSKLYTLIDSRENKLQPLDGNGHLDFNLRIMRLYYDVYASDVDKDIHEIYKIGKEVSLFNGSKLIINYCDSKHKEHIKTEILQ
jgi:hypothetical protein